MRVSPQQNTTKKHQKNTNASFAASQSSVPISNDHEMISATTRVIKNNLVYVIGIPGTKANKTELMSFQYFGRYGDIQNFAISKIRSPQMSKTGSSIDSYSAYITYTLKEEAEDCIYDVDGASLDGRVLRACYGTTKYCSRFLQGQKCTRPNCLYLHSPGTAKQSFSKKDLMSLRGTNFNGCSKLRCNDVKKPTKSNDTFITTCKLNPLSDDMKTCNGSHKVTSLYKLELERLKMTPVETSESHDAVHSSKSCVKKEKSHFGSTISSSLLELLQNEKSHKPLIELLPKKKDKQEDQIKPRAQFGAHAQEKSIIQIIKDSSNEEKRENDTFRTCEPIQQSTKTHQDSQSKGQQTFFSKPANDVSSSFPSNITYKVRIDKDKEENDTFEKEEKIQEKKKSFLQETCSKSTQSVMKNTINHSNNPSISRSSSNYGDTLFETNFRENVSFTHPRCYASRQMVSFSNNIESTQLTEPLYKILLNSLTSTSFCEEGDKSVDPFVSNRHDVKKKECMSPSYTEIQQRFSCHHPTTRSTDFQLNEYSSNSDVYSQPLDYEHSSFFFSPIIKRQQEQEQHPQMEERQDKNLLFNNSNRFSYVSNENEKYYPISQKAFSSSSTVSPLPTNSFFMPVKPPDDCFYPNGYNSDNWNSLKKTTESFPEESFFYHSLPFRHLSSSYTLSAPSKNSLTKQSNEISYFSPTSGHPDEKINVKNFCHATIHSGLDSDTFLEQKHSNILKKSFFSYCNQEWCDFNVLQSVLPNANINFSNQSSAQLQMATSYLPTTQLSNGVSSSLPVPLNPFHTILNNFDTEDIFRKKHMDYEYFNSINHSSITQIDKQREM
ncbi:uncharacterized protein LOC128884002 isoform X2 [Hylaeus volcanicus]|nr:uncharacterized protein LOC128884002 isoform X2 [Hylaeus volcanicus]